MLLSKHTAVKLGPDQANIIGHMCYAAYKLWNICNYERIHYKELNLTSYPDWYYLKSSEIILCAEEERRDRKSSFPVL